MLILVSAILFAIGISLLALSVALLALRIVLWIIVVVVRGLYLQAAWLLEEKAVPVRLEAPAQVNGQVEAFTQNKNDTWARK
jgi:hypothetical protein